jgi:glycosyltransferase involved in cell wall biosynthesis
MRVAVDGYLFRHPTRGMARFAKMLASNLGTGTLTLEPARSLDCESYSHTSRKRPSFPFWEQWMLPKLALASGVDVLLCPYNTGPLRLHSKIRLVLVLHDLIFMDKSLGRSMSRVQNVGAHYRRVVVPLVARKASQIVTVSEHSRHRIISDLGVPESRVTVIPNAIGEFWFQNADKTPHDHPYVLTVSGEAPSKNLARLIEAFAQVHNSMPRLHLIVVGVKPSAHPHFQAMAAMRGIAGSVRFTPFVSDNELRSLYWNAHLYVCASLCEGFGIPVLEAMATGTPLTCSNTSSIPEVGGDAAWYFNPCDTQSISSAMTAALSCPHQADYKVQIGRQRASHFSEQKVAVKVTEFWRRLEEFQGA